ncbi:MAG: winged helix-turn-helix transcriptional regulator [Deltaproteobacteria bacterium]|nr:winged helix-turn-helix transcriptional regulator [Deltaproteobacteria bacterium]MBW2180590.1 winged helix-turn-helix transcriptional regulator [Deltaproteobacteria bacterium]
MDDFINIMKALSDKNRVKIIKMLQNKAMCVCEIREALQISQPTVSKHMKILEKNGFVYSKKEGLWVNYHLGDGKDSPYVASILGNLRHWFEADSDIVKLMDRLPDIRREHICQR